MKTHRRRSGNVVDANQIAGVNLLGRHQIGHRVDHQPLDSAFQVPRPVSTVAPGIQQKLLAAVCDCEDEQMFLRGVENPLLYRIQLISRI